MRTAISHGPGGLQLVLVCSSLRWGVCRVPQGAGVRFVRSHDLKVRGDGGDRRRVVPAIKS